MSEAKKVAQRCTIKRWKPVIEWSYDSKNDTCGICRNNLIEICINCQSDPVGNCPTVKGKCEHTFHFHCIQKWLADKAERLCPYDSLPFDLNQGHVL